MLPELGDELGFVVASGFDREDVDGVEVGVEVERRRLVVDVGDAAGHAGREVHADRADDDGDAAGHVFAAVVTDTFRDQSRARVADAEALACEAVDVDRAGGGAVGDDVAGNDVVFRPEGRSFRRFRGAYRNHAAGERLADVVVGFAAQVEGDAVGEERAEGLPGDAGEVHHYCSPFPVPRSPILD